MAKTATDAARLLLRELGVDHVVGYFRARLAEGKMLSTRPKLISSIALLAGETEWAFLCGIAEDAEESAASRVAAVDALALDPQVADVAEIRATLRRLLENEDAAVRGAAARAHARLGLREGVPMLQRLLDAAELDVTAEQHVREFVGSVGGTVSLPQAPSVSHFRGRESELHWLTEVAQSHGMAWISGLAGSGKTALASQYFMKSGFDIKVWLQGAFVKDLSGLTHDALDRIAAQTGKPLVEEAARFDASFASAMIRNAIRERSALFVIDDADNVQPAELVEFAAVLKQCAVIAIFIGRNVPDDGGPRLVLDMLGLDEAHAFVADELKLAGKTMELEAQTRLVELSGGSPLILRLGVAGLGGPVVTRAEVEFPDVSKRLEDVVVHALSLLDDQSRSALQICAQFEQGISLANPRIRALLRIEHLDDSKPWLTILENAGLVQLAADDVVLMHRALREYVRKVSDGRLVIRTNVALAELARRSGDTIAEIVHLIRGDLVPQALKLAADSIALLTSLGHAALLDNLLTEGFAGRTLPKRMEYIRLTSIGRLEHMRGNFERSVRAFSEAQHLSFELRDLPAVTDESAALVSALLHRGQVAEAAELIEQGLKNARTLGDDLTIAAALLQLGEVAQYRGDYEKAIAAYQEGLAVYRRLHDSEGLGRVLFQLGSAYEAVNDLRAAAEALQEGRAIARERGDLKLEGEAVARLGELARSEGALERALELQLNARVLLERAGDRFGEGEVCLMLGQTSLEVGDATAATSYSQEALEMMRDVGNRYGEGRALRLLGMTSLANRAYRDAIDAFRQTLEVMRDSGDRRGISDVLVRLSGAHDELHEFDQALEYERAVLVELRTTGDRYGEGIVLMRLGASHVSKGDLPRAVECYTLALDIWIALGNPRQAAKTSTLLGDVLLKAGQRSRAVAVLEQGLRSADEDPELKALIEKMLSEIRNTG